MSPNHGFAAYLIALLTSIVRPTVQDSPPPPAFEPEGRWSKTCVLRVRTDPACLEVNPGTVQALLNSDAVFDAALREAFGVDARQRDLFGSDLGDLGLGSQDEGELVIRLDINGPYPVAADARQRIERFPVLMAEKLQTALVQMSRWGEERYLGRLKRAKRDFDVANAALNGRMHERRELSEKTQSPLPSREALLGQLQSLDEQHRTLQLELAASQAAARALEDQIGEARKRATSQRTGMLDELEQIVSIRQMEMARIETLAKAQQASEGDILKVREALAQARVQLESARADANALSGDVVGALARQLAENAVGQAELLARRQFIEGQIKSLRSPELLDIASATEAAERALQEAAAAVSDARQRLDAIVRAESFAAPRVELLGAAKTE
ncbi:MAG: hypothetical protein CHACPFDD_03534 [Phycisphaerae bacterium]|nr:hypothetical protein [Phycisphaerae bacterium]